MSKYKTPLPTDVESSKALETRTSKYRLPFKKDEPAEELHVTLNNLNQQNITLQSDIKLPKLSISYDLDKPKNNRKHKNNMSINEEVNMTVKSDREEFQSNYNETGRHYQKVKNDTGESKKSLREMTESLRQKQQVKSKPKPSIYNNKKRRFLSSASKYADDENADYTEQSEQEPIIKKQKGRNFQSQLPIIGEGKYQKIEKEDSDSDFKIWENLSKEIEKYQENKEKQQFLKNKIKQKNSKRRKSLSKKLHKLQGSQNIIIDGQFRKEISNDRDHKRSQSFAENSAFYSLLKQKRQTSPKTRIKSSLEDKEVHQSLNLMQKLKEIIAIRNEKLSKAKLKLPLQFYFASYEQIKQINPFFRKLSQMEGCILLSIGKLVMFEASKPIYCQNDLSKQIYIIIYGKVLLSNKYRTLRKFALTGQTLGEEQLFQNEKSYIQRLKQHARPNTHKYDAKALNKSCLLRIQLTKYYKMSCELNRMGYKQQFNLIDNLFRINYLNKQTNLHFNQRERIQTESTVPKSTIKHGAFFY